MSTVFSAYLFARDPYAPWQCLREVTSMEIVSPLRNAEPRRRASVPLAEQSSIQRALAHQARAEGPALVARVVPLTAMRGGESIA
jgi:hypothetical protein